MDEEKVPIEERESLIPREELEDVTEGLRRKRWISSHSKGFALIFSHLVVAVVSVALTRVLLGISAQFTPLSKALQDVNIQVAPVKSIPANLSPYIGRPDSSIDAAWHQLLANISIRVSTEELKRNGNHKDSVSTGADGEHMVWLSAFHQLHCLKQLRHLNYREHYFPNQTEHERRDHEVHINHCIENLRQSLMCNPDLSLTTFTWSHTQSKPVLDIRRFERNCVDWEVMMESVLPRVISEDDVHALRNPLIET